jgi:hypothetical protein
MTRGSAGARFSREVRSGAIGHVAVPEPNSVRRRGLELRGTWQYRSPPQLGGEIRSHRMRGSAGVYLSLEARSRAAGHVAVPEPTSAERRGLES